MTRAFRQTIVLALLTLFASSTLLAQQQGGGQFAQMREKYKYTFQLMNMARNIGEIDKDKKYTLKPEQAKKVLDVLKPLRSKPKLTQDQAKAALKSLKPIFTTAQLNAMARIKPRRPSGQSGTSVNRPGGPGGPGGPGRTGAPGGNRPRMRMDPNAMKDFNPFYAKATGNDEFSKQRAKRWNEFFANLEKKAKSAKPAPAAKKK